MSGPARVLMLAIRYPPSLATGTIRTLKFQKYLPEHGWVGDVMTGPRKDQGSPIVVDPASEGPGSAIRLSYFQPMILAKRIDSGSTVPTGWRPLASRTLKRLGRYAFLPDPDAMFVLAAFLRGGAYAERTRAIYATGMPWSGLVAAAALSVRTGLPLVVDLRDPWIERSTGRFGRIRGRLEELLEGWTLSRAGAIVVTSDGLRNELLVRRPRVADRLHVIPNGYDEDDFLSAPEGGFAGTTIVHTGNFYGSKGPAPLFEGIRAWMSRNDVPREKLRVWLVGKARPSDLAAARTHGIEDLVRFEGPIPHGDAVRRLTPADVLVAVDYGAEQARTRVLSKIFEYLRAGRPILLLTNGGCTEELVRPFPHVFSARPEAPREVAEQLERALAFARTGQVMSRSEAVRRFERRATAGQLAEVLKAVSVAEAS